MTLQEKVVFCLKEELKRNIHKMIKSQELTLNSNKPLSGRKGSHGLYGSDEWWTNIINGSIKTEWFEGIIEALISSGMGDEDEPPTEMKVKLTNGKIIYESLISNHSESEGLYQVGHHVKIWIAYDEHKKQPDDGGSINYIETVLKIVVGRKI